MPEAVATDNGHLNHDMHGGGHAALLPPAPLFLR